MEIIAYGGWEKCIRLSNDKIELIITSEVGPRVIRFGFVDEVNIFYEDPNQVGKTLGDEFRLYGGHRLWVSPEIPGFTDYPDNLPVEYRTEKNSVVVTSPTEKATQLQKKIEVSINENVATINHMITNYANQTVEIAPWALSVMRSGGVGFFPQEEYQSHQDKLLPVRPLVLWGYTDMSDSRWSWGKKIIKLKQTSNNQPQKVGALVTQGWAGYAWENILFLKKFDYQENVKYPDFGCNFETFTNESMLELESLGHLVQLKPNESVEHTEKWMLIRNFKMPEDDDALLKSVNNYLLDF